MAFPAITFRRVATEFVQASAEVVTQTVGGQPWVRVMHTERKRIITGESICTTALWDSLITDYEANHSTSFSWTDPRDSTALTVYYDARPVRRSVVDGKPLQPTHCLAIVRLREV